MSPLAVVLPGRAYPATRPALAAVVEVLDQHGYDIRSLTWMLPELPDDPAAYVVARLSAAARDVDLVVGKSMGAWASAYVAERRVPAVWVTPVLTEPAVAAGIRANPAQQLVVAGLADPFHDAAAAAALGCDLLELAGVDHALSSTGDTVIQPDILALVADATDAFLRRLR